MKKLAAIISPFLVIALIVLLVACLFAPIPGLKEPDLTQPANTRAIDFVKGLRKTLSYGIVIEPMPGQTLKDVVLIMPFPLEDGHLHPTLLNSLRRTILLDSSMPVSENMPVVFLSETTTQYGPMLKVEIPELRRTYNLSTIRSVEYRSLLPIGTPATDYPLTPFLVNNNETYTYIYARNEKGDKMKVSGGYRGSFTNSYLWIFAGSTGSTDWEMEFVQDSGKQGWGKRSVKVIERSGRAMPL